MLCLLGVLLSCGALCLMSPVPPATASGCLVSSLIQETLTDVQTLKAQGSSKIKRLSNTMEAGGNVTTHLEGFIETLKSSEERSKERRIARKLQKIQSCLSWMEQDINAVEGNFFDRLEYLLRFLNHYALPGETA